MRLLLIVLSVWFGVSVLFGAVLARIGFVLKGRRNAKALRKPGTRKEADR